MPELPEVEVVRRGLEAHALGRTITRVDVLHPRPVRTHPVGADGFAADLTGRRIDAVRRRGKFMWLVLEDDALVVHLGMSGQFRVNGPADELLRNTRVLFDLDDGVQLRFIDQRMFGGLDLRSHSAADPVPHIALDPFDQDFDERAVAQRLRLRRTSVKRAILDQSLVSGIGNIYADEALWRAGIRGTRIASSLSRPRLRALPDAAAEVMRDALAVGGTSFDSLYVNVNGESGYFARSLDAYGREGEPCARCGAPIRRERFMNRSSYSCPRCQVRPRGFSGR